MGCELGDETRALGNYPYSSSYILNGDGILPPYPLRVACSGAISNPKLAEEAAGGDALLSALADAAGRVHFLVH